MSTQNNKKNEKRDRERERERERYESDEDGKKGEKKISIYFIPDKIDFYFISSFLYKHDEGG
jgi:hypothetical protein